MAIDTTELDEKVEYLFNHWINGSLTKVLDELEALPSGKAAFMSGMLVAKMHMTGNEDKVEPFLRLQVDKYYQ
jgi:hypothetical protein